MHVKQHTIKKSVTVTGVGLHTGVVTDYALYILIGICFYLSIFTFVSIFFDLVNSVTVSSVVSLIGIAYYISTDIHPTNKGPRRPFSS